MTKILAVERFKEQWLENKPSIVKMMPEGMSQEKFMRYAFDAYLSNPDIKTCTAESIFIAVKKAARFGLYIGIEAHLVKFKTICVFIPDYRGLIKMYRKGGALKIEARPAYENEVFELSYGLHPNIIHKPLPPSKRGKLIATYAVAYFKEGDPQFVVCWDEELEELRAQIQNRGAGAVWKTHPLPMKLKTPIRKLEPFLPKDSEDIRELLDYEKRMESGKAEIIDADFEDVDDTPATQMDRLKAEAAKAKADEIGATAHPELKPEPEKKKRGRPKKEQPETPIKPPEPPKEPEASKDTGEGENAPQEANGPDDPITAEQINELQALCISHNLILLKIIGEQPLSEIKISTADTLLENIEAGDYDKPEFRAGEGLELE